jgi:hypothetical protein
MLAGDELQKMQREQFRHDKRNHADIQCLAKAERLKHYGLHYAKYVGRLARSSSEPKPHDQTIIDSMLVCLSAANTLHQDLSRIDFTCHTHHAEQIDPLRVFADASGRFADACEKFDHLEDNHRLAREANVDIMRWLLSIVGERSIDLHQKIAQRRRELAERQFYVTD